MGVALSALGVFGSAPTEVELAVMAGQVGGPLVLAAALAGALHEAAASAAMVTEDRMLTAGAAAGVGAGQLRAAREQVVPAGGATGPGAVVLLGYEVVRVAGLLGEWSRAQDLGPLGRAAADAAQAAGLLLQACTVLSPADPGFAGLPGSLAEASVSLTDALTRIQRLLETAAAADTLGSALFPAHHPG